MRELIEKIQDCAKYEDFLVQLLSYVRGEGGMPYISVSDPLMADVMSSLVEEVTVSSPRG